MTDNENALIAYAILDEVNEMITVGGDPAVVLRDIARAQVYATLATVPAPPAPGPSDDDLYVWLAEHTPTQSVDADREAVASLRALFGGVK